MTGTDKLKALVREGTAQNVDPARMVEILTELSGLSFFLGEQVAQHHRAYIQAEHERKMRSALAKFNAIAEGKSASAADNIAEVGTEAYRTRETEANAEWYRLRMLRDDTANVMDALRTRISYLKHERQNA